MEQEIQDILEEEDQHKSEHGSRLGDLPLSVGMVSRCEPAHIHVVCTGGSTSPCPALLPEGPSLALGMGVHDSSSVVLCGRQGKRSPPFYHRTNRGGEKPSRAPFLHDDLTSWFISHSVELLLLLGQGTPESTDP